MNSASHEQPAPGGGLSLRILTLLCLTTLATPGTSRADDITWLSSPVDGDWNNDNNWSPVGQPFFPDTAVFGTSSTTAISLSDNVFVGGIRFESGASPFTITIGQPYAMEVLGDVTNNSAVTQHIVNNGFVCFDGGELSGALGISTSGTDSWTSFCDSLAGTAIITSGTDAFTVFLGTSDASEANLIANDNGFIGFHDTTTGGNATISLTGTDSSLSFYGESTAGSATIGSAGHIQFANDSSAGSAQITTSGDVGFFEDATAGSAAITVQTDGFALFLNQSTGGTAAFTVEAGAVLDISNHEGAGVSLGSVAGDGVFSLGSKNLTVGGNNASTTVGGRLLDGSAGGSLTKEGTGTLTLSGSNAYSGPTTVREGTLIVDGGIDSSSITTVESGATIGGSGTVGNLAIAAGGSLSPGSSAGVLTVEGDLLLDPGATVRMELGGLIRGDDYDGLDVTGTFTAGGTLQIVFTNSFSASGGDSFNLFDWNLPPGTTFSSLDLPALDAGLSWDTSDLYSGGIISVAVPEPEWFAAIVGVALVALVARRREKKAFFRQTQ